VDEALLSLMRAIPKSSAPPTSPGAARSPSTHLPGLDGLRAIAVAAVVVFHVFPGAAPGGGIGVDMFFVISGFLITGLMLREKAETGRIRLARFWLRRARRLLPALLVVVAVCTTVALLVGSDLLVGIGRQVLGASTFSSNWLAVASGTSYFSGTSPELFRNLWSLAVEEQFYLAWPFVMLLLVMLRHRSVATLLVMALGLASATAMGLLYVEGADATRVYYGTDTHSFGLAFGAVLALVTSAMSRRPLEWSRMQRRLLPLPGVVATAALVWLAVVLPAETAVTFRGGLVVVAVLTAIAIWGAIIPGSILGRALDLPIIAWIGKRSYGLYLWHWPVFVILVAALPTWQDHPSLSWCLGAMAVALSTGAAALSYRFVETPIRRSGFRAAIAAGFQSGPRRNWRVAGGILATTALVASIGGTSLAIASAPAEGSAQADINAGAVAVAHARRLPAPPPGAAGNGMVAIGDSVMLAAAPELQQRFPGILIDAVVSRQMNTLPDIVRRLVAKDRIRHTLVIGLGTNGYIARSTLLEVRGILGPDRQIVLVNIQAPRGWEPSVNHILSSFAADFQNVELADWHHAIAPRISILAPDQIHPGPTGGRIYATVIRSALTRLSDLPPYPHVADVLRAAAIPVGQ
jgi:peptidoglycan/LPS O-acetylase OafA/YrhL